MSSLDQRVAYLAGRMEDHAALFADIRAEMRNIRADIRVEMTGLRGEMTAFRTEMDRRFTWMIGVLVGVLMGMVGLAFQIARLQPL